MKKIIPLFLFCIIFLLPLRSQITQFNFEVFPGLSELNIPSLIVSKDLRGVPRVFKVNIAPEGVKVILYGKIYWTPVDEREKFLYKFETKEFASFSFSNQDFDGIRIKMEHDEEGESGAFEDLMKKGKLTGTVTIELQLKEVSSGRVLEDRQYLEFLNPTQTLAIRNPLIESYEDVGSVLAEWDNVPGVTKYKVLANVRQNSSQSLEEALTSGDPVIDTEVGLETKVNLRTLLKRQWLPGQEIVLKVTAVVSGVAGERELSSEPVNFYLNNPLADNSNKKDLTQAELIEKLLEDLAAGNIQNLNIKSINLDGKQVSLQEIMEIIQLLKNNPDVITSKRFIRK